MIIKLDISKAYDTVKWCFIEDAMKAIGFVDSFVNVIMRFVKPISYKVLINGKPSPCFTSQQGLQQGDPFYFACSIVCRGSFSAD